MEWHDDGKSNGRTGGGAWEADAVEAEIFGVGADIRNAPGPTFFPQSRIPQEGRLTRFWRMLGLLCRTRAKVRQ